MEIWPLRDGMMDSSVHDDLRALNKQHGTDRLTWDLTLDVASTMTLTSAIESFYHANRGANPLCK
jgi:hypothetical protein